MHSDQSPSKRDSQNAPEVAQAWAARSAELADWAWERLVNRTDVWGGYNAKEDRDKVVTRRDGSTYKLGPTLTRPPVRQRGQVALTRLVLGRHFRARGPADVVGLHSTSAENTSRWGAIDVDRHGEQSTSAEVNRRAACGWYGRLTSLGFRPLLCDSNGDGGFHLSILFGAPVSTERVFYFMRELVSNHAVYGLPTRPETFPKQRRVWTEGGKARYGNFLRVPGRHHTREHWSRVWDGSTWLEGARAVDFILSLTGDPPDLIPQGVETDARVKAYMAKLPHLCEGQGRDDVAYGFAAWLVRDMALPDAEALRWLEEWDAGNRPPKGRERLAEILKNAHQYGQRAVGAARLADGGACPPPAPPPPTAPRLAALPADAPASPPPPPDEHRLGDLVIRPGRPRRTPAGKLVVPVSVRRDGAVVDDLALTSSASGRKDGARALAGLLPEDSPDRAEADQLVRRIIAGAADALAQTPAARAGPTLGAIIRELVPTELQAKYRTERGIWSEAKPGEMTRSEFMAFLPGDLLTAAQQAVDLPRSEDGEVDRMDLVRRIKLELEVCWADLLRTLPLATGAELGEHTAAGRAFHTAMVLLWTRPHTFELVKAEEGQAGTLASRASLISRVQSKARAYLSGRAGAGLEVGGWQRVHQAFAAWWRPHTGQGGEVAVLLALRWELASQIGVNLPGVSDQESLTRLGERYGVLHARPPVSGRTDRGDTRLAVLSQAMTDELLSVPVDEPADGDLQGT